MRTARWLQQTEKTRCEKRWWTVSVNRLGSGISTRGSEGLKKGQTPKKQWTYGHTSVWGSVFSYREVEAPWKLIVHYLQLNKETDLAHLIRRGSAGDQSSGCKHCGKKAMLGSFCKHCLLCSWTKGESPIPVGLICLHGLRHWGPSHSRANINNTHSLMASLCPYNALRSA